MLLRLACLTITNTFAALLTSLPRKVQRGLRVLVRPDTVLRRHRRRAAVARPGHS
ncbi:hypothetical protein [Nonomuraea insulae]|uniref:Uncharacterized protein n=1 Tax=Nonomuraea insulae TaxID=1616787 RepID=A0ABW1CPP1_9ACTN